MKPFKYLTGAIAIITMAGLLSCATAKKKWTLESPSGNLRFTVQTDKDKQLFYNVTLVDSGKEIPVISSSPLGIKRGDAAFITGLSFVETLPVAQVDETFEVITGKQRKIENKANELALTFKNPDGGKIQLIIRAYDDGVAFRYCFPETDRNKYNVEEELTGFAIAETGKAWIHPYDKVTQWSPAYETYYENGTAIGTSAPSAEGWAFPALFQTDNAWILLTEAASDSTYFMAHLQPKADNRLYTIRMPEETEACSDTGQKPVSTLPWHTPWRVLIIGKELSTIVESNMVTKLNPPSVIADETWIKPGRASWSWWSDAASPRNFASLKKFVDLAAEMGWEYSLVDANWDLMKGGNIEQLVKYANSRNVGILMWYNSGGAHNVVTERPRDIMSNPVRRAEEFKKLAAWGVKGVKVDFFQSDKQQITKLYFDILKDAADNHIMVNFHGCTLPKGWNRTWPNLVAMEAVRGAECYGFDSLFTKRAPTHNTIIPYSRNAVGSMDYTPVALTDQKYPHITTYGHELALSIVFESGLLHLADRVEAYRELPPDPKEFLKKVPVVWDTTLLLAGKPGEFCIMARCKDGIWYLGGINGTGSPLSWEIDLSRLGNKDFSALVITDGDSPRQFKSWTSKVSKGDKLKIEALSFGGFVAKLK